MFRDKNQLARLYGNHPNDKLEIIEDISVTAPRRHLPNPDSTNAVLLLMHGFGSVPETWDNWIEKMRTQEDIALSAPLMAGCGLFDYEKTWNYDEEDWYSSLKQEYLSLKERYPSAPFILVGHSLGGALVTRLASEFQEKNLFLVAPYFFLKKSHQLQVDYILPVLKNFFPKICLPAGSGKMHSLDKKKEGEIAYALNNWKLVDSVVKAGKKAIAAAPSLEQDSRIFILQAKHDAILDPKDFKRVFNLFGVNDKTMVELDTGHVIQVDGASSKALGYLREFIDKSMNENIN